MRVASQLEQQMRKCVAIDKYLLCFCGKGRELVEWIDLKKFNKIISWNIAKGEGSSRKYFTEFKSENQADFENF